jgi:hypothetical protein
MAQITSVSMSDASIPHNMNEIIETTTTMTNDSPPPYQDDAPPEYSPIPYQALETPVFYHINRPTSDYEVYSADEALAFYIQLYTWNISKPDMRLYQGDKNSGQKVAECRYGENTSPCASDSGWLRQSNPSHHLGGRMVVAWWTRPTRDSLAAVQYRFVAMVDRQPDAVEQESTGKTPRAFVWMKSSALVLLEEETRTVAASFHESTLDTSKCGTLEITLSYGNDFNLIVLTTFVALFEKQRRHGKRASGDPGEESLRGKMGGIMGTLKRA